MLGIVSGAMVDGCTFRNAGANYGASHSIYLTASSGGVVTPGTTVQNCQFYGVSYDKYPLLTYNTDADQWSSGTFAAGSEIYPNTQVKSAGDNQPVWSNNLFRNVRNHSQTGLWTGNNFHDAMIAVEGNGSSYIGNQFVWAVSNTAAAVQMARISGEDDNIIVSGNRFYSTVAKTTADNLQFAVSIAGDNWIVENNSFWNCQAVRCVTTTLTGNLITGNYVVNTSFTGTTGLMRLDNPQVILRDNTIIGHGTSGYALYGPGATTPFREYHNNRVTGRVSGIAGQNISIYSGTNMVDRAYIRADLEKSTNATLATMNEWGGYGLVSAVMSDATTAPTTMSTGWLYRDTTSGGNSPYMIYNGTAWVSISPGLLSSGTAQTIGSASATILATTPLVVLNPSGDYSLGTGGSAIIADGILGQTLTLTCGNGEANTVTLNSSRAYATSNVRLGADTRAVTKGVVLKLMFDGTEWIETSFIVNPF